MIPALIDEEHRRKFMLGELECEHVDGEWVLSTSHCDVAAVISYALDASPETGHIGWIWWAMGNMGEAKTYVDAKAKAEEVMRKHT